MKINHLLVSVVAISMLCGCEKEGREKQEKGVYTVLNATSNSSEVKTHLGTPDAGTVPVLFDATDAIWVKPVEGNAAKFTTSSESIADGGQSAAFSGTIVGSTPYYIVFPYDYASSFKDGSFIINVPKTQMYAENSFGITSNIAAAVSTDGQNFRLANLCGCLKLSLKGTTKNPVASIVVSDNDPNVALWGTCCASVEGDNIEDISFSNEDAGRNMVTLNIANPVTLSESDAANFYIVVPDGAFAKGFTISLRGPKGAELQSVSTDKNLVITRGQIRPMSTINVSDSSLSYSGGAGTEASPYRIATAQDLKDMVTNINGGTHNSAWFAMTRDIAAVALDDHIGTIEHPFSGHFDGAGYTISLISIEPSTDEAGQGLFGTTNGANIANVKVDGYTNASTQASHGVLVGNAIGTTIDGCFVSGAVSTFNGASSGAIAGAIDAKSVISNCRVAADLCFAGGQGGGIVGFSKGAVKNCTVVGDITVSGKQDNGGIVGCDESDVEISIDGCTYSGNMTSSVKNTGGILGRKSNGNSTILNCKAYGSLNTTGVHSAGIVSSAITSITIKNCESDMNIESSEYRAAGILAYFCKIKKKVVIDGCVVRGNIKAKYSVGGIIGEIDDKTAAEGGTEQIVWITNCAYLGSELESTGDNGKGNPHIGGIAGCTTQTVSSVTKIVNCVSRVETIKINSGLTKDGPSGILGTSNPGGNSALNEINSCYTTIKKDGFYVGGSQAAPVYYGALAGNVNRPAKLAVLYSYYDSSCDKAYGTTPIGAGTGTNVAAYTTPEDLLIKMNAAVAAYNPETGFPALSGWVAGEDGWPIQSIFSGSASSLSSNGALSAVTEVEGNNWTNY